MKEKIRKNSILYDDAVILERNNVRQKHLKMCTTMEFSIKWLAINFHGDDLISIASKYLDAQHKHTFSA